MSNKRSGLRAFDNFAIDLERKVLWIEDSPVDLPFKAVEMLCLLIEGEGNVVSKEELLDGLWQDSFVEESVLAQNVYLIRKTFEKYGSRKDLIENIPRRGYRFAGEVTEVSDEYEITIERQTIERKFVAGAESSELEDAIETAAGTVYSPETGAGLRGATSKRLYLFAGLIGVMVLGSIGASWFYNERYRRASAPSAVPARNELTYERLSDSGRAYYVGLSHDNQNAAYVIHTADDKYSLILHHLPSNSKTEIVAPQAAHLHSIIFSPDGNYIYYAAQQGKKPNTVYRIPIYGGSSQAIAKNFAQKFSLSPDGDWLAFYRWELKKGVHVEICRSLDGSEKRLVTTRSGNDTFQIWGQAPEWSPDGKKLITTGATRDDDKSPLRDELLEIDISTGRQTRVKTPDWYRIGQSYWEGDGKGLFLLAREDAGEPVQIWHLDYSSGAARNVTNDKRNYLEFRPSSDSSFLVAATRRVSENLFLVSPEESSKIEQLTFDTDVQNGANGLKWTPDGKHLVFSRTKAGSVGNIWVYDLENRRSRQLTVDKGAMHSYIDVTPDGKSAVFGSNRNGLWNIWQIDLDGENLRQLTNGVDDGAPEISPDGKWLFYIGNGLWKRHLEGGEPIRIMDDTPGTTRISPADPDKIISYYADPDEEVEHQWKFILYSEGDPHNFSDLNLKAIIHFEWKPDGSGIYFADRGESFNNLWFLTIDGKVKTQLTSFGDQKISNLSLSPDGRTIAVSRGQITGNVFKISGIR